MPASMSSSDHNKSNRLAQETSPYLLQHARNPVDWYSWGEPAFAAARASGKPVLLSVGYSACHWCHVMAHESFEDPATAAVMNELFVNIKVDREERPDVDRIYQLAHQLLTRRSGGWPLTMFLCHDDQRPFFGGTYFPPQPRHGMPAFTDLLRRVAQVYQEHAPELRGQSAALVEALQSIDAPAAPLQGTLSDAPLQLLRVQLEQRFDREHGGFSPAPKFPHAGMIEWLLRRWHATADDSTPDLQALFMATLTLKRMAEGGLFDQLGGGFCRYSVDERWEIPHFEKMLYDNGSLLSVYAAAAAATGEPQFARVAAETGAFMLRDLQDHRGAFHAAWDADSEGHEGLYYLWTPEQVRKALDAPSAERFIADYGLDRPPNFEGRWHLVAAREPENPVQDAAARATLLQLRMQRVPPGRDDKILTGWNALAIRGLADAARALDRPEFAAAAAAALEFLRREHWRDGRLLATSRDGDARLDAYLDDHAYLLAAILSLLTVRFEAGWLGFATDLADALLLRFEDREHGGFYFTAHDHEALIHRSRNFHDDATPSGNAVAAGALLQLGWLLGEPRYLESAERALRAAWSSLADAPLGQVAMATALDQFLNPQRIVILRGAAGEIDLWRRELQRIWRPDVSVLAIPADAQDLPQVLAEKVPRAGTVAYLCQGSTCSAPLDSLPTLLQALRAPAAGSVMQSAD
jgi:uncharacterized protein YyaL (SSP411 family)